MYWLTIYIQLDPHILNDGSVDNFVVLPILHFTGVRVVYELHGTTFKDGFSNTKVFLCGLVLCAKSRSW